MIWPGAEHKTVIMEVSDALEWSLIESGAKTALRSKTRLLHPEVEAPCLVILRNGHQHHPYVLSAIERQELRELTERDANEEGFESLAAFKRDWCRRSGDAYFSPAQRVWTYRFAGKFDHEKFFDDLDDPVQAAVYFLTQDLYPPDLQ